MSNDDTLGDRLPQEHDPMIATLEDRTTLGHVRRWLVAVSEISPTVPAEEAQGVIDACEMHHIGDGMPWTPERVGALVHLCTEMAKRGGRDQDSADACMQIMGAMIAQLPESLLDKINVTLSAGNLQLDESVRVEIRDDQVDES